MKPSSFIWSNIGHNHKNSNEIAKATKAIQCNLSFENYIITRFRSLFHSERRAKASCPRFRVAERQAKSHFVEVREEFPRTRSNRRVVRNPRTRSKCTQKIVAQRHRALGRQLQSINFKLVELVERNLKSLKS